MKELILFIAFMFLVAGVAVYFDEKAKVSKIVAHKTYQGGFLGAGHLFIAADGTSCTARVGKAFVTKVGDTYTCLWR